MKAFPRVSYTRERVFLVRHSIDASTSTASTRLHQLRESVSSGPAELVSDIVGGDVVIVMTIETRLCAQYVARARLCSQSDWPERLARAIGETANHACSTNRDKRHGFHVSAVLRGQQPKI